MNPRKEDLFILIADDDPDDQYLTRQALRETGFSGRIEAISSGEKLMSYLFASKKLPDLILLDLNMPTMDGFNVLELIRSNISFTSIPVHMLLSISHTDMFREKAMKLGASHCYIKPDTYKGYEEIASTIYSAMMRQGVL